MHRQAQLVVPIVLLFAFLANFSYSAYSVTAINTTLVLGTNTTAKVTELINVSVSNQSIAQYSQNRLALNLTLSQWQSLVGSDLVEHVISPRGSIYAFNFTPGPLAATKNGEIALFRLTYYVTNVTTYNQTGPRLISYKLSGNVFNFQNAVSGEVLGSNTTLTVVLPSGSRIITVYPIPDAPTSGFAQNYRNTTELQWFGDEPLSKFVLTFTVTESPQSEVVAFFTSVYGKLGWLAVLIVAIAIAAFIFYAYMKAGK